MQGEEFLIQLLAKLDTSSVNEDYEALKKRLTAEPFIQKFTFDTSMSKQAVKDMASEIHNELAKAFKKSGIETFNIDVKDVESILSSAVRQSNRLAKELDKASSNAQKFLSKFNNKTGGTLINSKEFKEVESAISGLGDTHSIEQLNSAMNTLETTYNNMVANLRTGSKSLNPFINAITDMSGMDNTLKSIGLEFEKLSSKPKLVADSIKQLSVLQSDVNKYPQGTLEWSEAYGRLKVAINAVNAEIRNLAKSQSANIASKTVYKTDDLKNNNIAYMTKVSNTINKQMVEIQKMAKAKGFIDFKVSGVEKADGLIKNLTLTVTDAEGAIKKLNFQREQLQGKGKAQPGLMQVGDTQIIKTSVQAQEELSQKMATNISRLESMKSKWAEQGILVDSFKDKVEQLQSSLTTVSSNGELKNLEYEFKNLNAEAQRLSKLNKIQLSVDNGTYSTQIDKLEKQFQRYGLSVEDSQKKVESLKNILSSMESDSGDGLNTKFEKWNSELKSVKVQLDQTKISYDKFAQPASKSEIDKALYHVQGLLTNNSKAVKSIRNEWKMYRDQLSSGAVMTKKELSDINIRLLESESSMRSIGKLGLSVGDSLKKGMGSFTTWVSATSIVMGLLQAFKDGVKTSGELDDALTNINYTMDVSSEQLSKIGKQSVDMAKNLRTSSENIFGAVKLYANAKETAESILEKARPSIMLSNVTGFSGEQSAKYLQTIMNQFKLGQENLMNISDIIQSVSQNMAHDFADGIVQINEGISTSGEVAKAAGMDLADYASMIGLIVEKTGLEGGQIGNSLKTIITRTTKAGKIYGTDEGDISKAEEALRGVKIEVRKTKDEFNAFNDTMSNLSKKWDTLSDVEKSNISFNLAGTRQINVIQSLLSNWSEYEELVKKANNSAGVTLTNQEKYVESLESKYKKLTSTMDSIATNLFKSDDIGDVVGLLQSFANVIDLVTEKLGSFGTFGLGAGLFASIKNFGRCV